MVTVYLMLHVRSNVDSFTETKYILRKASSSQGQSTCCEMVAQSILLTGASGYMCVMISLGVHDTTS